MLHGQDQLLGRAQRRVARGATAVVRGDGRRVLVVDGAQLLRAGGEHDPGEQVMRGTDPGQVPLGPVHDRRAGHVLDRQHVTTDHGGRAVADDQLHRLGDAARPEALGTPAGDQERLVDVVVRDGAELVQVHAVEVDGDGLDDRVADRVRMAEPLALDDLLAASRDRCVRERLDHEHGFIPSGLHALGTGASRMPTRDPRYRDVWRLEREAATSG